MTSPKSQKSWQKTKIGFGMFRWSRGETNSIFVIRSLKIGGRVKTLIGTF